jgi:indole-3-glycerol phosphate synthase
VLVVSESGIGSPAQLKRLGDLGVDAVLVGESLMRSADPEAALRALQAL